MATREQALGSWKIIKQFIVKNEDEFMEFLEDEHDIEGSDAETVIKQVEDEVV